ncbi:MAG: glycosyltransferase [Novosphingobium sp.]|nr:glycosyltransferase [Novosphingobium sp.]
MARPVFYDPSGRRRRMVRRGLFALLALLVAGCLVFASTVVSVPAPAPLQLGFERMAPLPFRAQVSRLKHKFVRLLHHGRIPAPTGEAGKPLTVAFYTSWTDESAPSLERNLDAIDWVAPTLLAVAPSGQLVITDDPPLRRIMAANLHHPLVVPVVQNVINEVFNGPATAALLRDPAQRKRLIGQLDAYLDRTGDGGVVYDFENLPPESIADYRRLIAETRADFAPRHRIVSLTLPLDNPNWRAADFAPVADKLFLMAYDEHWQGGIPGPIASNAWFESRVAATLASLPSGKAIVALGNYGYDWHDGKAESLTVEEAWLEAHDSSAAPVFDRTSGNIGYAFTEGDHRHDVWMLDAATAWNQMQMLDRLGIRQIAMWRLGSEDPGFWHALSAWRGGNKRPDLTEIEQKNDVDVEGQGEILRITSDPQPGRRTVDFARNGTIVGESYQALPTPYVVQRTGRRDKLVSLTFDDGPDPVWTPQILSILERFHVPATFFIIGENAVSNRDLLRRIVRDGDEIGNHTYTHPNLAEMPDAGVSLELNATQRLIEASTGRSTRLFRAPYFGDAEPTTADELGPAEIAQDHGYTVVGLHVDAADWKRPGVQQIVDKTVLEVENPTTERSANIVLLHDGGGNRAQTVAALPAIITRLEQDGYRFVPTAHLAGLDRDAVMPRIAGSDLLAVRADLAFFSTIDMVLIAIKWTFFFAIALGIARAVVLTLLALLPLRRRLRHSDSDYQPLVSVIIPAFNEERVIESSVRRVLGSDYANLQVIVADDGSRDTTSAIVAAAFGDEPRVTLLTLVNGGKAAALNRALATARGHVVVALDADTQFEPETISRLVRWFADERIGAVAGNAKVGNRVNLVTRWQAVEYVTAQNLERRALTRFDAVMVVPGAVGAWRREALDEVGGFPEDTLAEDQDLTIAIQRQGWKIAYDDQAVAWTEAPESFRSLGRQRFRWAYGTLQCLWKHRAVLASGRPSGLAFVGMPQAWLFQIVFAMISPAIDLALMVSILGTVLRVMQHGWAQTETDVIRMTAYWLAFSMTDLVCGWIAYRLDVRHERFRPVLLLSQRFIYRQLMYGVVIRAVSAALGGLGIGWGKLERSGRVSNPALRAG